MVVVCHRHRWTQEWLASMLSRQVAKVLCSDSRMLLLVTQMVLAPGWVQHLRNLQALQDVWRESV
jgi:hypothetical protein